MKVEMKRDMMEIDAFVLRVSDYAFERYFPQQFENAMGEEIKRFVREDPEVRILINEMVRQAFQSVNLLEVVTKAVQEHVAQSTEAAPPAVQGTKKEKA